MPLNLIKEQISDDYNIIDNIYFYFKDPNKAESQYVIKTYEEIVLKESEDSKHFIKNSNDMQEVHKNIEE